MDLAIRTVYQSFFRTTLICQGRSSSEAIDVLKGKKTMDQSKTVQIIILVSGIIVASIYGLELWNDYYFYFTKREAPASLENLYMDNKSDHYVLTIRYTNEDSRVDYTCVKIFEWNEGKKIVELNGWSFPVYYKKGATCDVYFKGHYYRAFGTFLLHSVLFQLGLLGIYLFIKNIKISHDRKKNK